MGEEDMKHLVGVAMTCALLPVVAHAQSPFRTVSACLEALDGGDAEAAQRMANEILTWDNVISVVERDAEQCLTAVFGEEYRFVSSLGFATEAEIDEFQVEQEALRAEQEIRQSEAALRGLLRSLNALYEGTNENLVATSVYEACLNLSEIDPDRAFTNDACINSFRQNGHPELPSFASFAVSASPLVLDQLENRDRELLESLSQEQVEELCQGEFEALCTLAGVGEQP
ncbi:hypothetical protein HKCCSP123_03115 [Rhodobacterales bacterium HKCCSP123]|nr:hypothetical protein [Rhodobacterales bacterium HKCCSP123]